jgi:predicted RND superfamily exporter protein
MQTSPIQTYAQGVIRFRWWIILLSFVATLMIANGGKYLTFDTDYRVFFSDENPELLAFEKLQNIYSKKTILLLL